MANKVYRTAWALLQAAQRRIGGNLERTLPPTLDGMTAERAAKAAGLVYKPLVNLRFESGECNHSLPEQACQFCQPKNNNSELPF